MPHTPITENEERRRGELLIELLGLKFTKQYPDRVETSGGTKTTLGLYRTVKRLIETGE